LTCLWIVFGLSAASAFDFVGPFRCTVCHEHRRATLTWQNQPASLGRRTHFNSASVLTSSRSTDFARAVGLSDPAWRSGSCVSCHGTPFGQRALTGVSCESCHGEASGYVVDHQVRGSYGRALEAGMRPLRGRPDEVRQLCESCHVIRDRRLVAAGHPTGKGFVLPSALRAIVHWGDATPRQANALDRAPRTDFWNLANFRRLPSNYGKRTAARPTRWAEGSESQAPNATVLRFKALRILTRLLDEGAHVARLTPSPPSEFQGPDGELHRIADEAFVLMVEALKDARR